MLNDDDVASLKHNIILAGFFHMLGILKDGTSSKHPVCTCTIRPKGSSKFIACSKFPLVTRKLDHAIGIPVCKLDRGRRRLSCFHRVTRYSIKVTDMRV